MIYDTTILLIDDDPSVNYLNSLIIEKAAIQANVCGRTKALEALEALSNGELNPNLIFLDLDMPIMDGWQFLEKYKELPHQPRKCKIIVLSSTINPSDKEKASHSPFITDFYSKPLSIDDVKKIKETIINKTE